MPNLINAVTNEILAALGSHNAVILSAPPGTGKSTSVPLMLLDQPWLGAQRIFLLEPRRLAARAVATRMAELLGEPVGQRVGYRTRFDSCVGPNTRIEVVTDGVLLRLLLSDPSLEGIGVVIFDEFHERGLPADTAAALVQEVQESLRPDLRLLFMSATLQTERLQHWLGDAPVLSVSARSFPVETLYSPVPARHDWIDHLVRTVLDESAASDGNTLVFLPGQGEIRTVERRLASSLPSDLELMVLHGGLSPAQQRRAIIAGETGRRRVLLSTAIAESAVTVDGVSRVIDAGWQRLPLFDPGAGMGRLHTQRLSRASADQRAGRAGRQGPGRCLRLWSAQEVLADETPVQINQADLSSLVLDLAAWGCRDPEQLRWLDPPPKGHWQQAVQVLQRLQLLDARGAMTVAGKHCQRQPMHPRLASMVMHGEQLGCARLALKLAIVLEAPLPPGDRSDVDIASRLAWFDRRHDPRAQLLQRQFKQLSKRMPEDRADADGLIGELLLAAYPDRLARRRAASGGRYLLRNGRGAVMPEGAALTNGEWLVVADSDGDSREVRIRVAAVISAAALERVIERHARWVPHIDWHDDGRLRLRQRHMLDAICIKENHHASVDDDDLMRAMLAHLGDDLTRLPWTPALRQWQRRMQLMHALQPGRWPDVSDAALQGSVQQWLSPYLSAASRARDLGVVDLRAALYSHLDYAQKHQLDDWLPTSIVVPSGRQHRIDYTDALQPVLEVKLQEMFGLIQTPTLAQGRVVLMLHLLSPARRPLAITSDLNSFWQLGYVQVRKELRGRYPKHPWPEDPFSAQPTAHTRSTRSDK